MNRIVSNASRMFKQAARRLKFEAFGLVIPPFTASFVVKRRRKRAITIRSPTTLPPTRSPVPFDTVLDTIETITETERKRAIRSGDWIAAIGAALVQDYVRQNRRKS